MPRARQVSLKGWARYRLVRRLRMRGRSVHRTPLSVSRVCSRYGTAVIKATENAQPWADRLSRAVRRRQALRRGQQPRRDRACPPPREQAPGAGPRPIEHRRARQGYAAETRAAEPGRRPGTAPISAASSTCGDLRVPADRRLLERERRSDGAGLMPSGSIG